MPTEIEKKYRLTSDAAERLRERLRQTAGAEALGAEFETNTLYAGAGLEVGRRILRLRRAGSRAVLTLKEREPSTDAVKRQREEETEVGDAEIIDTILRALGYTPALRYEKRRETWRTGGVEVVIDELPFGWYAEIEGEEEDILAAERALGLADAPAEHRTYPDLTREHGARSGAVVESRFVAAGQGSSPDEAAPPRASAE